VFAVRYELDFLYYLDGTNFLLGRADYVPGSCRGVPASIPGQCL
jgi:hypothetical protein